MKRVLLLLVVLAILIGGSVFFFLRHAITEGAQLLPSDSVLYVTVPDVQRTMGRWPKTALAQIGAEPAVAEFLGKPFGQVFANGGADAMDLLFRVKPGRLFFGVTTVNQTGAQVILGFEFFGGRKDLDVAMGRLYHELGKKMPNAATTTYDYKGDAVTTFGGEKPAVYSGAHGSWGFISNSEIALEQSLDRAAGREKSPALVSSQEFKNVLGHLSKNPDFFWYARPQPVFDLLAELAKKQQTTNAKQFDQMRKIKGLGGTLLFDEVDQKEVTFLLYPEAPKIAVIDRAPLTLTTPDTMIFYDASMDWKTAASDEYMASLPPEAAAFFANAKIDLKQLPEIFGNDLGFLLNWSPNEGVPSALLSVEVKDRSRAEALATTLFNSFGVPVTPIESKGARVFGIPGVNVPMLDPSLAITDKAALLSLTTAGLDRALSVKPGDPTLEGAPAFLPARSAYKEPVQAFGYVDSKAIFERVYNLLRPIAILAGSMSPAVGKVVDVNKLPDTETISRHLHPILYANKQVADGMLIESSGPITLSQATVLISGGAGAVFAGKMMSSGH